jgi:hypothetical protein
MLDPSNTRRACRGSSGWGHRALRPIRHSNERRSSDRDTIFFELLATKRAWLSLFWGRGSNEAGNGLFADAPALPSLNKTPEEARASPRETVFAIETNDCGCSKNITKTRRCRDRVAGSVGD